jgi:hypothetical protein
MAHRQHGAARAQGEQQSRDPATPAALAALGDMFAKKRRSGASILAMIRRRGRRGRCGRCGPVPTRLLRMQGCLPIPSAGLSAPRDSELAFISRSLIELLPIPLSPPPGATNRSRRAAAARARACSPLRRARFTFCVPPVTRELHAFTHASDRGGRELARRDEAHQNRRWLGGDYSRRAPAGPYP